MKNRYCNPETATYELDNEHYFTLDDLAGCAEYRLRAEAIRCNVCTALCGIHLMGFLMTIIFMDVVANWPLMLLGFVYCLAGTVLFGLLAGGDYDGSDNG